MNYFNSRELTEEKSLYDIFKKSITMQYNRLNLLVIVLVLLALIEYVCFTEESIYSIVKKIRWMTDVGLSFASTILGFLIAGFTIFATITDKNLFVHMAKTPHPTYKFSYFKYSLFAFMYVFVVYIAFLLYCFTSRLFFDSYGTVPTLIKLNLRSYTTIKNIGIKCLMVFTATWIVYLILLLKTFAYNIYHVVTISIRWEIEKPPQ